MKSEEWLAHKAVDSGVSGPPQMQATLHLSLHTYHAVIVHLCSVDTGIAYKISQFLRS